MNIVLLMFRGKSSGHGGKFLLEKHGQLEKYKLQSKSLSLPLTNHTDLALSALITQAQILIAKTKLQFLNCKFS